MHTCNILYINIIHVYTIYINNEKSNNKIIPTVKVMLDALGSLKGIRLLPQGAV